MSLYIFHKNILRRLLLRENTINTKVHWDILVFIELQAYSEKFKRKLHPQVILSKHLYKAALFIQYQANP